MQRDRHSQGERERERGVDADSLQVQWTKLAQLLLNTQATWRKARRGKGREGKGTVDTVRYQFSPFVSGPSSQPDKRRVYSTGAGGPGGPAFPPFRRRLVSSTKEEFRAPEIDNRLPALSLALTMVLDETGMWNISINLFLFFFILQ